MRGFIAFFMGNRLQFLVLFARNVSGGSSKSSVPHDVSTRDYDRSIDRLMSETSSQLLTTRSYNFVSFTKLYRQNRQNPSILSIEGCEIWWILVETRRATGVNTHSATCRKLITSWFCVKEENGLASNRHKYTLCDMYTVHHHWILCR